MIPGEMRTQTKELKKAPTAYFLIPPRRKVSLPKSWPPTDLQKHGAGREADSRPGDRAPAACCWRLPCSLRRAAAGLRWVGNEPRAEQRAQSRAGLGGLELTLGWLWHPGKKTLSGKSVTRYHDFHSSWRSAGFWDSQHTFLSSPGSE